jgi:hypothetical protein
MVSRIGMKVSCEDRITYGKEQLKGHEVLYMSGNKFTD